MPLVRMVTSVAGVDFDFHAGDEVDLPAERAQQAVAAGWGELVRSRAPETPERAAGGRGSSVETTDRQRTRRVQRRD